MISPKQPLLIAHRGDKTRFPENSLPAFNAALAAGADGIELDIQLSKDEAAVIFHDRTLYKAGGGLARVRTRTAAQLELLEVGHGDQATAMPYLTEVLSRFGGRIRLLLELKTRETDPQRMRLMMALVVAAVQQQGLNSAVDLLCFDLEILRYGASLDPGLQFVWNQDQPTFEPQAGFLHAYSVNIKNLNKAFVAEVQRAGTRVYTFTVNTEKQLKRALECGVDGIMADDPVWLRQRVRELLQ